MWSIASVGVALEMVTMLIPWSLGIIDTVDPLLARTLFWLTGHPIVYFWLLPVYVSWYTMVPRMLGVKLYSESMARTSLLLFLILSTPVGLHHQFTDPGIDDRWKAIHAFLTFAVFFPSLLTFFNLVATIERAGRARGGKGWLGWIWTLPWGDPGIAAQLLAMILFVFGGIGGLTNASYDVNLVIHNTAWVVGHFHLTVGAAVTLSFMGISYWLIPYLTGRQLWSRWLALVQAWTWFVGMAIFSETLHRLGLEGMPRRTEISAAAYVPGPWHDWFFMPMVAVGGMVLFASGTLYFVNVVMTAAVSREKAKVDVPLYEAAERASPLTLALDRWRTWVPVSIVLIVIAYGPTLLHLVLTMEPVVGRRLW
jgi:cytochrome c oxidase subunit 1